MKLKDPRLLLILAIGLPSLIIVYIVGFLAFTRGNYMYEDSMSIQNFEQCEAAGFPVMESFPRQCRTADGVTFVESLDDPDFSTPPIDNSGDEEYYGSSTFKSCNVDTDCQVMGCNSEICGARDEGLSSICIAPNRETPLGLGYACGCFEQKCQWGK